MKSKSRAEAMAHYLTELKYSKDPAARIETPPFGVPVTPEPEVMERRTDRRLPTVEMTAYLTDFSDTPTVREHNPLLVEQTR